MIYDDEERKIEISMEERDTHAELMDIGVFIA